MVRSCDFEQVQHFLFLRVGHFGQVGRVGRVGRSRSGRSAGAKTQNLRNPLPDLPTYQPTRPTRVMCGGSRAPLLHRALDLGRAAASRAPRARAARPARRRTQSAARRSASDASWPSSASWSGRQHLGAAHFHLEQDDAVLQPDDVGARYRDQRGDRERQADDAELERRPARRATRRQAVMIAMSVKAAGDVRQDRLMRVAARRIVSLILDSFPSISS